MTTNEIDPAAYGVSSDRGASTLKRIGEIKGQMKALKEELEGLEQMLRIELGNDMEPVVDLEHGIVGYLKEKKKPAMIDLSSMAKHPDLEAHIIEAARAGALVATLGVLRPLKGKTAWADALLRFEMLGGVTHELKIEETR